MENNTAYVAYIAKQNHKQNRHYSMHIDEYVERQEATLQHFVQLKNGKMLRVFVELGDNRRSRHPWPELEAAVEYALSQNAHLIVDEIQHYLGNESFTKYINRYVDKAYNGTMELYCCDLPHIRHNNFKAINAHTLQQRKYHGQLIKRGLNKTQSKSGNPNAMEVINQINKPKIDNAVVFSLVLAPVINAYRLQGLSQRKIVQRLNDEGFHAPEGGLWVLSQLQKILYRINVNETALSLEHQCKQMRAHGYGSEKIAQELAMLKIPSPFKDGWTSKNVEALEERVTLIHEILDLHDFILMLSPILEKYHVDELDEEVFKSELLQHGIQLPQSFIQN